MRGRKAPREEFGLGAATSHSRLTYRLVDAAVTVAIVAITLAVPVVIRVRSWRTTGVSGVRAGSALAHPPAT